VFLHWVGGPHRSVSSPINRSRLPSRRGVSSGLRKWAGLPLLLQSASPIRRSVLYWLLAFEFHVGSLGCKSAVSSPTQESHLFSLSIESDWPLLLFLSCGLLRLQADGSDEPWAGSTQQGVVQAWPRRRTNTCYRRPSYTPGCWRGLSSAALLSQAPPSGIALQA
jgi:hypothetical protein